MRPFALIAGSYHDALMAQIFESDGAEIDGAENCDHDGAEKIGRVLPRQSNNWPWGERDDEAALDFLWARYS